MGKGETLSDLRKELFRQRNLTSAKRDIIGIGRERAELRKQIKAEKRKRKFGQAASITQRFTKRLAIGGKKIVEAAQRAQADEDKRIANARSLEIKARSKRKTSRRSSKKRR